MNSYTGGFPSESYARLMALLPSIQARFPNMNVTTEMLAKNVLEVNVYYEETSYKLIEQSASLGLIDLIASLGGTIGEYYDN